MQKPTSRRLRRCSLAGGEGDREVLGDLASLACDDLRAIARGFLCNERREHALQGTALANELYLRPARQGGVRTKDRSRLYTLASTMRRRIPADYTRRTRAYTSSLPTSSVSQKRTSTLLAAFLLRGGRLMPRHGRKPSLRP
ncbi:MAG: ECF-type sigma factor [Bryobacteraceae bacterium]